MYTWGDIVKHCEQQGHRIEITYSIRDIGWIVSHNWYPAWLLLEDVDGRTPEQDLQLILTWVAQVHRELDRNMRNTDI